MVTPPPIPMPTCEQRLVLEWAPHHCQQLLLHLLAALLLSRGRGVRSPESGPTCPAVTPPLPPLAPSPHAGGQPQAPLSCPEIGSLWWPWRDFPGRGPRTLLGFGAPSGATGHPPGTHLKVADGGGQRRTAGAGLGEESQAAVEVQHQRRMVLELPLAGQEDAGHLQQRPLPARGRGAA